MELLLIRHAQPVRIERGEVEGPADPGLTERGTEQATIEGRWDDGATRDDTAGSSRR